MTTTINYSLDLTRARYQEARITISVMMTNQEKELTFYLPTWSPGSYRIRDYSRHVFDVSARDDQNNELEIIQNSKNTWTVIPSSSGKTISFTYSIHGEELSPRTNYIDHGKAVLVGPATFMGIRGMETNPHEITVQLPRDWTVQASLPTSSRKNGQKYHFEAVNYDLLVDTPFVAGNKEQLATHSFTVMEVPHQLVLIGRRPRYLPLKKIIKDLTTLIKECAAIFGGELPYDRYYFHLILHDKDLKTGLEHLYCNLSMFYRYGFLERKTYEEFLSLEAHEFFHVWNVKRIRASGICQENSPTTYNYDSEQYTKALWLHEGFTSYYSWLILLRAKLISKDRFWEEMERRLKEHLQKPGRKRQSLEQSSWNTWINLYQPDSHHVNKFISYYRKGQLIGLFLDFYIRLQSQGANSLDDVMLYLWNQHGKKGIPFNEEKLTEIIMQATSVDISEFYQKYISGTEDLPLHVLKEMGFEVKRQHDKDIIKPLPDMRENSRHPLMWLGCEIKPSNGGLLVSNVFENGPSFGKLLPKDLIIAIDRIKVTKNNYKAILRDYSGTTMPKSILITFFRGDELLEHKIRPKEPVKSFIIKKRKKLRKNKEKLIKDWMLSKQ